MTRKDFELIAEVVAEIDDKKERAYVAYKFAWRLSQTNTRFNADRFLKACNVKDEE